MTSEIHWYQREWVDPKLIASMLGGFFLVIVLGWNSADSGTPAKKQNESVAANAAPRVSAEKPSEPVRQRASGRQLTLEKMQQKKITTQHFAEDVYGVSFDAPQGYILKQGELPDMDLGLGYLGSLPMEFSVPGGVRVATVEVPRSTHPGTDFVNAFLTVSAFPNTTAEQCALFSPELSYAQPPLRQRISGIEFTGIPNSEAASMHEYFGKYFHGYSEGTCYEVGYGIVTAAAGAQDGLRKTNNDAVLRKLERILNTINIVPPLIDVTPEPDEKAEVHDPAAHKSIQ